MDNYTIRELPDNASALKHLWCRSGVYYFVRRIPVDVQQHYRSKRVSMSLRTRSLAAAFCFFFAQNAMALEEAQYRVVHQNEAYEIRLYDDRLVAQVEYDGENSGFRTLFNFISGANTATSKIEMTTPVTQSIEIEMTTPVSQYSDSSGKVMQFFMPSKFTEETVPEPTNQQSKLRLLRVGILLLLDIQEGQRQKFQETFRGT